MLAVSDFQDSLPRDVERSFHLLSPAYDGPLIITTDRVGRIYLTSRKQLFSKFIQQEIHLKCPLNLKVGDSNFAMHRHLLTPLVRGAFPLTRQLVRQRQQACAHRQTFLRINIFYAQIMNCPFDHLC